MLGKLKKVDVRSVWKSESNDFTPWLASEANIQDLGDELKLELEVLEIEKNVGPFRADILCKNTATDHYVIIENQFGKTDHTHLGQIMTYASGLDAFTVVWIAEKFTEEHRAALDWLNKITDENIEFYGIEIELFRIADSLPAPMFNLVSKPNSYSKAVKKSSASAGLTETKLLQQQYWQKLKEYVETQTVPFKLQKALPQHWTNISIGRTGYRLAAFGNSRDHFIGVQLIVYGENSLKNFVRLRDKYKTDSAEKLIRDLEWAEKEGKEHHVNWVVHRRDPLDKADWENQHLMLTDMIVEMYRYFKPKILKN